MEFLGVYHADRVYTWESDFNSCTCKEQKVPMNNYETNKNKDNKHSFKNFFPIIHLSST